MLDGKIEHHALSLHIERKLNTMNLLNALSVRTLAAFLAILILSSLLECFTHAAPRPQIFEQDLNMKLAREVVFIPHSKGMLQQLIDTAQHYELAMGIEIVEPINSESKPPRVEHGATVQQLITAILQSNEGYQATSANNVLHIFKPQDAYLPHNLLNLSIRQFSVRDVSLIDANAILRLKINMTLYPEEYKEGYIGDYGSSPDDIFNVKNVTFAGVDLTVRQILNEIIKANGNALWVARIVSSPLPARDAKAGAKGVRRNGSSGLKANNNSSERFKKQHEAESTTWTLIPLNEKSPAQ